MSAAALLLAAATHRAPAQVAPQALMVDPTIADAGGLDVALLKREVRRFDFEEAEQFRVEFPSRFKRYLATDQGFPPFGTMRLTNETAAGGRWSLEFGLDGGSLAARVPTGIIPVMPMSDYQVTAQVRTADLVRARARVSAWLADSSGQMIPESYSTSRLLQTNGAWQSVSLAIYGDYPDANDLVIELELLQPRQFGPAPAADAPMLEDMTGRAWFDDVAVWHLPRLELATSSPGNVILPSEPARLNLLVSDLTAEKLSARVRVFDLDDEVVIDQLFEPIRGSQPMTLELGELPYGWYRALAEARNETRLVGTRDLEFVVAPAPSRRLENRPRAFVAELPSMVEATWTQIPELLSRLGVGSIIIDLDGEPVGRESDLSPSMAMRMAIEKLLADRLQMTFAVTRFPESLAASLNADRSQVLRVLAGDLKTWRVGLEPTLNAFGRQIRLWQAGATGSGEPFWDRDLQNNYDTATHSLATLIPGALISVPWSIEQEIPASLKVDGFNISIPHDVQGEALAAYARTWPLASGRVLATIEPSPDGLYDRRQQLLDLMMRSLHAWRAGLTRLSIAAPWTARIERRAQAMPKPLFAVWRTLAQELDGRRFTGEMNVGAGLRCWILEGRKSGDAALVAWNESAAPGQNVLRALLADGPVRVIDAFGNERVAGADGGVHSIALGSMPVFIEGIDAALAGFRAGFSISPGFIPAIHRMHELHISLVNPWDVAIAGRLRIDAPERWQISPRTADFTIRPHDRINLPLSVVLDRGVLAGRQSITAAVELSATHDYVIPLTGDVEVGLDTIALTPSWTIARNVQSGGLDLVITQFITNIGAEPASVDAYVAAPGISAMRRSVAGLGPGQTAVRVFVIPDGAGQLSGRRVRLGVADRDGAARLNTVLDIPILTEAARIKTAGTTDERR